MQPSVNQTAPLITKGEYRQFGQYGVAFEVLETLDNVDDYNQWVQIRILESDTLESCKLSDILSSEKVV